MILTRRTTIADWDHDVNDAAEAFETRHHRYPNLLATSATTYATLDRYANRANARANKDGATPTDDEEIELTSFQAAHYTLAFIVDDELSDGVFKLIYDSDVTAMTSPSGP